MSTNRNVTRLSAATLLGIPLALMLAPAAKADIANPLSVEIGVGYATSSDVRNNTSSDALHAGVGYNLPNKGLLCPLAQPSIDLDYNRNAGQGNSLDSWGLLYTERVPLSVGKANSSGGPYAGFGIGVFRNIADAGGSSSTTTTTTATDNGGTSQLASGTSKTTTALGGKALIGVSFGAPYVELSYEYAGPIGINGDHADSINLAVGTHF